MTMTHLTDKIAEFVFNELSGAEAAEAERHLAGCSDCRGEVEAFRRTRALLRALPDAEPPRRIVFETEKPAVPSWVWRWLSPAGAAVAASVMTALLMTPAAPPAAQPVERIVVERNPAAQPVDYGRIVSEIRASQEKLLASELQKELQKRDAAQTTEIQRLRTELAYLESLQLKIHRENIENASSIQLLAQKSESRD
jgi:anti-sigma factor RsiW